jgi:hypothetical protein
MIVLFLLSSVSVVCFCLSFVDCRRNNQYQKTKKIPKIWMLIHLGVVDKIPSNQDNLFYYCILVYIILDIFLASPLFY